MIDKIKEIVNKIRLKWFFGRKSIGYSIDFTERIYQIYLNHNKVIHYRNGYPVYSLSSPAVFSKPAVNMFARNFFSVVQNRNLPNLASFAINDTCNANCQHCSFFTGVDRGDKQMLTLEQMKQTIKAIQDLGVPVINFVGGEPLMLQDLPAVIKSVNKNISTTVLFTNGWFLEEKAKILKKSGLDSVYVSIDSANREEHDKRRGKIGMFDNAILGVKAALRTGLSVGISCCISQDDFESGKLKDIIEMAKDLKVHEVIVFDCIPVGRLRGCTSLFGGSDWIEKMIKYVEQFNNDLTYPGILIYAYNTSYRSTGCAGGTSFFYISPYGDVSPCDFNHNIYGNILEKPLYRIWDEMSSKDDFKRATWGGCKMKDPHYNKS